MPEHKDPLRQLVDVALFAPIGLLALARQELPRIAAIGRTRVETQITLARFVAKLAATRARTELQRRLDVAGSARTWPCAPVAPGSSLQDTSAGLDPAGEVFFAGGETLPEAVGAAVTETLAETPAKILPENLAENLAAGVGADGELPIDGYDSLAASQVVGRLGTLTPLELDDVRKHELSHRARRTILGKISQLQAQ